MFGTLRFILALVVIQSHAQLFVNIPRFPWFNQGASALVGFFLLSGYLMKYMLIKKYGLRRDTILAFYTDRFVRIFPHYWFYTVATFLFLVFTGFSVLNFKLMPVVANFSIVGLNFFRYWEIRFLADYPEWAILIPPAWTLAVEFQFYLIAPFLIKSRVTHVVSFLASYGVFILAALEIINGETYGYRSLAGLLFIFLSGSMLYDLNHDREKRNLHRLRLLGFWVVTLITWLTLAHNGRLYEGYTGPILAGYIILLPVVYLLSKIPRRFQVDDFLGSLSYGMYLNHYPLVWVLDYLKIFNGTSTAEHWGRFAVLACLSIPLSYLSTKLIDSRLRSVRIRHRPLPEEKVTEISVREALLRKSLPLRLMRQSLVKISGKG
jgi:peptidoglycan/LPS O-acetylase OafA/YrhL